MINIIAGNAGKLLKTIDKVVTLHGQVTKIKDATKLNPVAVVTHHLARLCQIKMEEGKMKYGELGDKLTADKIISRRTLGQLCNQMNNLVKTVCNVEAPHGPIVKSGTPNVRAPKK